MLVLKVNLFIDEFILLSVRGEPQHSIYDTRNNSSFLKFTDLLIGNTYRENSNLATGWVYIVFRISFILNCVSKVSYTTCAIQEPKSKTLATCNGLLTSSSYSTGKPFIHRRADFGVLFPI